MGRTGPGRLKHLQTRFLWLQERCRARELEVCTVGTDSNPGDMGTKVHPKERMELLMRLCKIVASQRGTSSSKAVHALVLACMLVGGRADPVVPAAAGALQSTIQVTDLVVSFSTQGVLIGWKLVFELLVALVAMAATAALGRWLLSSRQARAEPEGEPAVVDDEAGDSAAARSQETQTQIGDVTWRLGEHEISGPDLLGLTPTACCRCSRPFSWKDPRGEQCACGGRVHDMCRGIPCVNLGEGQISAPTYNDDERLRAELGQTYYRLTVPQLKGLLSSRGLQPRRLKPEVVKQLVDDDVATILLAHEDSLPTSPRTTDAQILLINNVMRHRRIETVVPVIFVSRRRASQWLAQHGHGVAWQS